MSYLGNEILAVIPARGGSKGIPKKNLCKVASKSLVGYAALIASSLDWIDRAVISTDDEEIAAEGKKYGLEAPFMRPSELASDTAESVDMWRHAWLASEEYYGCHFDISILLEPTSPLRRQEEVRRTVKTLIENDCGAAVTVSPTPAHFTPHKTLTLKKNGIIGFYLEEGHKYSIRQKIPTYYHRNGICYAVKRQTLIEQGTTIEENCVAIVIERPVVNIDDFFDLELAEFILSRERKGHPLDKLS